MYSHTWTFHLHVTSNNWLHKPQISPSRSLAIICESFQLGWDIIIAMSVCYQIRIIKFCTFSQKLYNYNSFNWLSNLKFANMFFLSDSPNFNLAKFSRYTVVHVEMFGLRHNINWKLFMSACNHASSNKVRILHMPVSQ